MIGLIQLHVHYHINNLTVDEVVAVVGQGALLAKGDIELAYTLIPAHPNDRPLVAMQCDGHMFIDPMLPRGGVTGSKGSPIMITCAIYNTLHSVLPPHTERSLLKTVCTCFCLVLMLFWSPHTPSSHLQLAVSVKHREC